MHNSFYFLRKLSDQLNVEFIGNRIIEIFSQKKDELILILEKEGRKRIIRAFFHPELCCLSFPAEYARARRNSVDLFGLAIGKTITQVVQTQNDRSFYFAMEDGFTLLFKMHGLRSNIVLLRDTVPLEIFRNKHKADLKVDVRTLEKTQELTQEALKRSDGNYKLCLPTFGNAFDDYLAQKGYWSLDISGKFNLLSELLHYLESPDFYIHIQQDKKPVLTFQRNAPDDKQFSIPTEALNELFRSWVSGFVTHRDKHRQIVLINQQIEKARFYIQTQTERISELESASRYDRIADLLMAHLHLIKPHSTSIRLPDFYTGKETQIRLNPDLSPQENAARYYRKSKKQKQEILHIRESIAAKEHMINGLNTSLQSLENNQTLNRSLKASPAPDDLAGMPYHRIIFMNYEILIGKNAAKNDQLTFKIAHKNDLFLHAYDVPGSHVIIRQKSGENIPRMVIEKAAAYAAFSSKSKGEGFVRVAYTQRKYVRKSRGMAPGMVVMEREKTLLAVPESFKK